MNVLGTRVSPAGDVLDPGGIVISAAPNGQSSAALAYDGTNSLAVWLDARQGAHFFYGARVTGTGVVLDPEGIPIATNRQSMSSEAIAFDGVNYLAVWQAFGGGGIDVYGARISPSGSVLDPSGIPISTESAGQLAPATAFDGTNYLVAWGDFRSGSTADIYAARVSPNGTVLDVSGIPISTAAGDQNDPSIAFDGTNYFVVWKVFDGAGGTTSTAPA